MRLKIQRPIIFFDLETTGTDPQKDRIVELALVKMWPDGSTEEKCRRFNPGMVIPKEATAVHGISNDDVKDKPTFDKVARGEQGVAAYFAGCDLGGYNIVSFDIPMLRAELERAGETLDLAEVAVVDAFRIFVKKEPRTLVGALRFYCGQEHTDAHSAMADVRATIDVLEAQIDRYDDLPAEVDKLDGAARDPDAVDRQGKLKWLDGEVAVSFGRHKGRTLRWLAREEPDYIHWMIDRDVAPDAVAHLHDALVGHFAKQGDKSNSKQV